MMFLLAITVLSNLGMVFSTTETDLKPTNLLFIMFDDLRPELSIYGREHMITPNFERLAAKSVVFDYSFCQVAVCNPSRDSLMTGLRPDSVGTYNFAHSYWPHIPLPAQLVKSGYNTAGVGKMFHWETSDKNVWSFDAWDNKWYDYQNFERGFMNSSTMPDRHLPIEKFRDYEFVEHAIETWKKMLKEPKPFMLGLGFKLPHLAVHIPYKYYEMYKGKSHHWKLSKRELRFPTSTPEIAYRCCAEPEFHYMREEGGLRANRSMRIGDINSAIPEDMHDELMIGYVAAVTFVDTLLGKLLDFMDDNKLWETTTVVLSADHGMQNGEKGIWEKWTLFEEATRVPLLISHPLSPYKGQHYKFPVESIDIYATLNEILKLPVTRNEACQKSGLKCKPLQGKSLAPIVLGKELYEKNIGKAPTGILASLKNMILSSMHKKSEDTTVVPTAIDANAMPVLEHNFALTQVVRCIPMNQLPKKPVVIAGGVPAAGATAPQHAHSAGNAAGSKVMRVAHWQDCDVANSNGKEFATLGYSMRTPEYRYTAYFVFNRTTQLPEIDLPPYEEELYDHKNETLADFTHRETSNLAVRPVYSYLVQNLRTKLVTFIRNNIVFGDH